MSNNEHFMKAAIGGEQYCHSLFENMLTGLANCEMIFDAAGKPVDFLYMQVNPMFEKLTGLKNVVGKKVTEVIPDIAETNPEILATYGRVATTGVTESFETHLPTLGLWLYISVYSIEKGYFTAVFDNITDRKKNEENLRKSLNEMNNLMDALPQIVYLLDTKRHVVRWNRKAEVATGYSRDDLSHKLVFELIPDHERLQMTGMFNEVYDKSSAEVDVHLLKKDGTTVPYRWSGALFYDEHGRETGIIGTGWDLTAEMRSETRMKSCELQQQSLLDAMPDSVWMKDTAGRYVLVNAVFLKYVSKKLSEVIGKTDFDFFPKQDAEKYRADDAEVMKHGSQKRMQESAVIAGGKTIQVETIKTPMRDAAGNLLGVIGVARIHEEKQ